MEVTRTTHDHGFLVTVTAAGTPIAIDLSVFAGRYVRIYSPDADLWFTPATNAAILAATDLTTLLGDPTTDSTTAELAGAGTILPEYAAVKQGEQFVPDADSGVVVDAVSGSSVRVFVKPTSRPRFPI